MGRKAHGKYIEAGVAVLNELGGGPISTKTLVAAAQERGLVPEDKWVYHNFSRAIRESELFDTSVRGKISLTNPNPLSTPSSAVKEDNFVADSEDLGANSEPQELPSATLGGNLGS